MTSRKYTISLRDVDSKNVRAICDLAAKEEQKQYVVTNAIAIAEACYSETAWFRAVYANEIPVGLIVLEVNLDAPEYLLWRFMIDSNFQGLNVGRQALTLIIDHVKSQPESVELLTSVVPGAHCPQGFYESLGFEITGEWLDGEAVMKLSFREGTETKGLTSAECPVPGFCRQVSFENRND
jgi:diamine N-acetyltransferase